MTKGQGGRQGVGVNWLAPGWTLFIVFLSVWPFSSGPDVEGSDKVAHILMYAFTTLIYSNANMGLARSVLYSIGLGAAMEVLQAGLPWRSFSGWDILANVAGAGLVGAWIRVGLPVPRAGWKPRGRGGRGA